LSNAPELIPVVFSNMTLTLSCAAGHRSCLSEEVTFVWRKWLFFLLCCHCCHIRHTHFNQTSTTHTEAPGVKTQ